MQKPISLPPHPFKAALQDFGADELVAGGVDAVATTAASLALPKELHPLILPFVGPVLEKVGFFPLHFWQAYRVWKTTTHDDRETLWHYVKQAMKASGANLAKDILIHDPCYIGGMSLGVNYAPSIPAGMLSAASYIAGILIVAGIDVTKDEFRHRRFKKAVMSAGFGQEQYHEARFCVKHAGDTLGKLTAKFGLGEPSVVDYHDVYYRTDKLPQLSGRKAKLRLRTRGSWNDDPWTKGQPEVNTVQIVFTRAREEPSSSSDQCRYFVTKKEKLWHLMSRGVEDICDVPDMKTRAFLQGLEAEKSRELEFRRRVARNNELAVCIDEMGEFGMIELKCYRDTTLLKQAMRYVMVNCPVAPLHVTHGKTELVQS